jgi:hypothetical protein
MPLLSVADVRALVTTALDDTALSAVIVREEAIAVQRLGAPGDGTTERIEIVAGVVGTVFVALPILNVTAVAEQAAIGAAWTTVAAGQYEVDGDAGALHRAGNWAKRVRITYVPVDSRERWRGVLIEVIRLALEQTAMRSESVGGEYSYQAPEWEAQRVRLLQRLKYASA